MASVNNQSQTAAFNPFKMIGDAATGLASAVTKECGRIVAEATENIAQDLKQVATGIEKGGFLGGAVEFADVMSPGHQFANLLDATNVIPENAALKEGLSAAVNFLTGHQLVAFKDVADALGQMSAMQSSGSQTQPNAPQTPAHPSTGCQSSGTAHAPSAGADAPFAGSRYGINDWGCGTGMSGMLDSFAEFLRWSPNDKDENCGTMEGKLEAEERKLLAEIKKILANPCLDFEDMVFHLMRAVIKGTQKQVRVVAKSIATDGEAARDARTAATKEINAARKDLRDAEASGDTKAVSKAERRIAKLEAEHANAFDERTESRNDKVEVMKNIIQKLTEMQQALSNILNSQHETALAAVRAIR